MYVKQEYVERIFDATSKKFQGPHIQGFIDEKYIEDFQLLLSEIAKKSEYKEGEKITRSDLLRIKNNAAIIYNAMAKKMDEEKEDFQGKERIQYDPFSALVTVNDYLYAMTMKALGSPYIPESFGDDMLSFIRKVANTAEFKVKETDYAKTAVDRCYNKQRWKSADKVRKTNAGTRKQILDKKATPYRVAQYAGEYFALKKRQEGHGEVWRFFHKKENEARTKLLADMKKTLEGILEEGDNLDDLTPLEIAEIYNKQNLAKRSEETLLSGIAKRNGMPSTIGGYHPTSTARTDERDRADDLTAEELRIPLKFDRGDFSVSEPTEEICVSKVEDKIVIEHVTHDSGDEEIDLSNHVIKL